MKADIVLIGNNIFTGETDETIKGAVAIKGKRIQAIVGPNDVDQYIGANTKVYEMGDKLILPGIVDCHVHTFLAACFESPYMVDLRHARSMEEVADLLREFGEAHPEFPFIAGGGWLPGNWEVPEYPQSPDLLDKAVPGRPVYTIATDYHTMWINTLAMETCGITKDSTVSYGSYGKDKDGELTGVLYDFEACAVAMTNAYAYSEEQMTSILDNYFRHLASNGITSIGHVAITTVFQADPNYDILKNYARDNELTCRVNLFPPLGIVPDLTVQNELRAEFTDDKLRVAGLKQFFDGVTYTFTAALLEPYCNNPGETGKTFYPREVFKEVIELAQQQGWNLRLHVIGDAAIRMALDIVEESMKKTKHKNLRVALEHVEVISETDVPRFGALGIVPSIQTNHMIMNDNEKIEALGLERAKWEYPNRTLLDTGAILAFGSDNPVVGIESTTNLYAAVTRCDYDGNPTGCNPEQAITLAEALRAYTLGSSYAIDAEKKVGTLTPGKFADVAVFDGPMFGEDPKVWLDRKIDLTICDGKVVFER